MGINSQFTDRLAAAFQKNKKLFMLAGVLALALLVILILCSKTEPDFEIVENPESKTHDRIDFFKNGERVLTLEFAQPYRIGFMQKTADDGALCTYSFDFIDRQCDYRSYLTDIKGDNDKRYLIAANYAGSSSAEPYEAYLLDAADNFNVIGKIPAGENVVYPKNNPELIFDFSEVIADYANAGQAVITLPMQLIPAQGLACVAVKNTDLDLEVYKNMLAEPTDSRDNLRAAVIGKLYCDLASSGLLKQALKNARQLGFTDKEIVTNGGEVLEKIRRSKFYKYIYELNDRRP
ncbi:MAG: hypothetical protein E7056_01385 [Lentisphaerae bacterium]|nr:hypothetical protein [Lentisphaerota bacterium]